MSEWEYWVRAVPITPESRRILGMTEDDEPVTFSIYEADGFVIGAVVAGTDPKIIDPGPSKAGSHRLADADKCLRKHFLKRDDKRHRPSGSFTSNPYFARGALLHLGLAQYYARMGCRQRGLDPDAYMDPVRAMRQKAHDYRAPDVWRESLQDVIDTFEQYVMTWDSMDRTMWEIVAVEKQLEIQVEDPERGLSYTYTQRLDLAVRNLRTNRIEIWDHKTTGTYQNWTKYRYEMALQFMGYKALGNIFYGEQFGGVQINYIQLQGTDSKGKRIDAEFHRPTAEIAPASRPSDLKWKIIQVERALADWDPDTNPDMETSLDVPGAYNQRICRPSKQGACEFYDLCHSRRRKS